MMSPFRDRSQYHLMMSIYDGAAGQVAWPRFSLASGVVTICPFTSTSSSYTRAAYDVRKLSSSIPSAVRSACFTFLSSDKGENYLLTCYTEDAIIGGTRGIRTDGIVGRIERRKREIWRCSFLLGSTEMRKVVQFFGRRAIISHSRVHRVQPIGRKQDDRKLTIEAGQFSFSTE